MTGGTRGGCEGREGGGGGDRREEMDEWKDEKCRRVPLENEGGGGWRGGNPGKRRGDV